MSRRKRIAIIGGGAACALIAALAIALAASEVDNRITDEDRSYIAAILRDDGIDAVPAADHRSYEEEIAFIRATQHAVLKAAPVNKGLDYGRPREPKDVYVAKHGLCYDRSRVIEKVLRANGFVTRHLALYARKDGISSLRALRTPGNSSHAVTEVRTQKGWLVVDSNEPWISIDSDGMPISIAGVRDDAEKNAIRWREGRQPEFYETPFVFLYGLYSRHGRFYPPFNPVPDVEWSELVQNF